jgi:transposase-like protein DUF772
VAPYSACGGRPSIDPVVFFKLQLVMFFEDIRSERQLLRVVADRLGARWYLGYDLDEPLPDHSSLTHIRERYGLAVFRRFFEVVVERCIEAGLVRGKDVYIDATKMVADAAVESVTPRFAVAARAHVDDLFAQEVEAGGPPPPPPAVACAEPVRIGPSEAEDPALAAQHASRHDFLAQAGRQERSRTFALFWRASDRLVSTTDPDATHLALRDGTRLGYQGSYLVDGGQARIILAALATPAEVPEERVAPDLLWYARARWRLRVRQATGDKAYATLEVIRLLEEQGVRAYLVLPDYDHAPPTSARGPLSTMRPPTPTPARAGSAYHIAGASTPAICTSTRPPPSPAPPAPLSPAAPPAPWAA